MGSYFLVNIIFWDFGSILAPPESLGIWRGKFLLCVLQLCFIDHGCPGILSPSPPPPRPAPPSQEADPVIRSAQRLLRRKKSGQHFQD